MIFNQSHFNSIQEEKTTYGFLYVFSYNCCVQCSLQTLSCIYIYNIYLRKLCVVVPKYEDGEHRL